MRPNHDPGIKTKNRLGGESIAMGIHAGALQKVMDILTNLYSDPTAAVIREYSTNARDSHIAAGLAPVPIKVTLPTTFAPVFQVQDFGVGLSLEDIREIYSQYGASTKEGNDDETGYLGMGSKSGLTYTDQFTVTAVKDGKKVQAVVARSDDGTASIRVLHEGTTLDGNGVTIKMPVKNVREFELKAEAFFRWWAPGTVELINGYHNPVDGRAITDDIHIIEGNKDYAIMGGVAYPINSYEVNVSGLLPYNESVAIFVPMGSVNFTPSREELHYTTLTRNTLTEYQQKVKENLVKAAEKEVSEAATHSDALLVAMKWSRTLSNHKWTYKGTDIPTVQYSGLKVAQPAIKYDPNAYGKRKAWDCDYLDARKVKDYVFITGFTGKSLSGSARSKMELYAEQNNLTGSFIFVDDVPCLPWTEACKVVDYEDVRAIKLPKTARGSSAPSPWEVYRDGQGWVKETDIKDADIVYLTNAWLGEAPRRMGSLTLQQFQEALPNATFVLANANRWDRLTREYPKAKHALRAIEDELAKRIKRMTEEAKAGIADEYVFSTYERLNAADINDPEVKRVVEAAPNVRRAAAPHKSYLSTVQRIKRIVAAYDERLTVPSIESELVTKARECLDTYPFIRYNKEAGTQHTIAYINALHKENN